MAMAQVDMLVGDIYGDRDYSAIGLSASTIASSFGKVLLWLVHVLHVCWFMYHDSSYCISHICRRWQCVQRFAVKATVDSFRFAIEVRDHLIAASCRAAAVVSCIATHSQIGKFD